MAVPCATVCRPGSTLAVGRFPEGRAVGRVGAAITSTRTRFSSLTHRAEAALVGSPHRLLHISTEPTELPLQNIDAHKMTVRIVGDALQS